MRSLATVPLLLCIGGCNYEPIVPVEVGAAAPVFNLMDLQHQKVSSDSLEGEIVVLAFWSTDCVNCIQEIDELNRLHDCGAARIVAIALDDDSERVRRLAEKKEIKYQVLLGDQRVFERFDGFSIPYTLVLDRSGRIRRKFIGPTTNAQFDEVFQEIGGTNQVASLAAKIPN